MSEQHKREPWLADGPPHELRILNGLHRGAVLPLGAAPVVLGTGDDADVVLADHGIAADHALLERGGDGWLLTASGGDIYAAGERDARTVLEIGSGGFARLGEIWLMIATEDAHWETPPPIPDPGFDARAAHPEAGIAMDAAAAPPQADTDAAAPIPPRPRPRHLRRAVLALSTLAMLCAATAYALTTHPAAPIQRQAIAPASAAGGPEKMPAPAAVAPVQAPDHAPSRAELAELFRKRLADAELLNRFDLHLDARAWSMQAQLDDEESARFEHILNSFIKEHHITFPVSAKAVTAEAMLPFKIGQVISGANPSLVTTDGTRLYVGDDYRGVRVVAIAADRLTFFGKRKIDVLW